MKNRILRLLRLLPRYLCLGIVSLVMIFPFYWMFVTAFKTVEEMSVYPPLLLPGSFRLDNFIHVLQHSALPTYFLNSLLTTAAETLLVLLLTILTAYGLYLFRFRGQNVLFAVLLLLHSLPFEVIMVFIYRMILSWQLQDTLLALILPFCFNFMYVYILYNAFCTIPRQVTLSAALDGASPFKLLWKIALPHARPSLIFITIMNAVGCWNSFVWPMMITNSVECRTLPFGLYTYMTETGARNELVMAMSLLSQLPVMLLFILLRKQFLSAYQNRDTVGGSE